MHLKCRRHSQSAYYWANHRVDTEPLSASSNSLQAPEAEKLVIIAGYGRVGQNIARGLDDAGIPYRVIELDPEVVSDLRLARAGSIYGDASNLPVLSQAGIKQARVLVVTFPDPLSVLATIRNAMFYNPHLKVVARVHRAEDAQRLKNIGVEELVSPEYEASLGFLKRVLASYGRQQADVEKTMAEVCKDQEIIKSCLNRAE